jgi:hypothetical protein
MLSLSAPDHTIPTRSIQAWIANTRNRRQRIASENVGSNGCFPNAGCKSCHGIGALFFGIIPKANSQHDFEKTGRLQVAQAKLSLSNLTTHRQHVYHMEIFSHLWNRSISIAIVFSWLLPSVIWGQEDGLQPFADGNIVICTRLGFPDTATVTELTLAGGNHSARYGPRGR